MKIGISQSVIPLDQEAKLYLSLTSQVDEDISIERVRILSDDINIKYEIANKVLPQKDSILIEIPFCVTKVGKYNDVFLEVISKRDNTLSRTAFRIPTFESRSFWTIDIGKILESLLLLMVGIIFGWIPYLREKADKLSGKLDMVKGSLFPEVEEHIGKLEQSLGNLEIKAWNDIYKSENFFTLKRVCYGRIDPIEDYYNAVKLFNTPSNNQYRRANQKVLLDEAKRTRVRLSKLEIPYPIIGYFVWIWGRITSTLKQQQSKSTSS